VRSIARVASAAGRLRFSPVLRNRTSSDEFDRVLSDQDLFGSNGEIQLNILRQYIERRGGEYRRRLLPLQ